MRETTNLAKVKEIAITLLNLKPTRIDNSPFINHPYLETCMTYLQSQNRMFNIFEDKEAFQLYKEEFSKVINKRDSVLGILMFIRKPYRLFFLDCIQDYLSQEDFDKVLIDAWITTEFPMRNGLVDVNKVCALFKQYNRGIPNLPASLPDTVKIYRGITNKEYADGVSWSLSRNTAEYFAKRFSFEQSKPVIVEVDINKSDIFAYIPDRGEEEIIISLEALKNYELNYIYL